ncbi:MAG TPA: Trk system potassium transporter TrkA [Syntrophales bacterium]|nr:Trk system potassium transporter TrkA [Syntrophales bacterium]HPI58043.1 Trk system potassium transporter TrkA [Syntrophales bacterium]HQM29322.1 Trk system potassium transporter TrkA [Syntrophales bacterium]
MKIIIVGAGEVGYNIADVLSKGQDVTVIDQDEKRLQEVAEKLDVLTVHGKGSSPQILRKAGLDSADMVIAVTNSDDTNMVACLLASSQSNVAYKVARIRNPELDATSAIFDREHLNIDLCINPEREAVKNALNLIDYPGATEIIDFVDGRVKLIGFVVNEDCPAVDNSLRSIRMFYPQIKALVTSIIRKEKLIEPTGSTRILAGDYVFAVTASGQLRELLQVYGKSSEALKRIFIMGGGNTGFMLAEALQKRGLPTKLIEKRHARCEDLASLLEKVTVLHGDGTDQELLKEENIQETDCFIAVTDNEEANILGALLAKRLGAKKSVALINRVEYMPLVSTVGIEGVINPRHAAVSKILNYVRKGKIVSATPLHDERVEAYEAIALETADITDRPIKDIKFPPGTIVGAIIRKDEILIPDGDSVIRPDDHVIIFTFRSTVPKLEKMLTVKLDYFE